MGLTGFGLRRANNEGLQTHFLNTQNIRVSFSVPFMSLPASE